MIIQVCVTSRSHNDYFTITGKQSLLCLLDNYLWLWLYFCFLYSSGTLQSPHMGGNVWDINTCCLKTSLFLLLLFISSVSIEFFISDILIIYEPDLMSLSTCLQPNLPKLVYLQYVAWLLLLFVQLCRLLIHFLFLLLCCADRNSV